MMLKVFALTLFALLLSPDWLLAVDFDGTNDYVTVNDASSLDITGSLTLSCWWKPDVTTGNQYLISKYTPSGNQRSYLIQQPGDELEIFISQSGSGNYMYLDTTVTNLAAGTWYHVVGVYTTSPAMNIYVNNVDQAGSLTGSQTSIFSGSSVLNLGSSGTPDNFANGQLSDVRVYNRALSRAAIECAMRGFNQVAGPVGHWLLSESTGSNLTHPDISGNGNTGTGVNGAAGVTEGPPTTWHSFGGN